MTCGIWHECVNASGGPHRGVDSLTHSSSNHMPGTSLAGETGFGALVHVLELLRAQPLAV